MNYHRNNLDLSSSPYLIQHKDNPIYWQEWSQHVLNEAQQQKKPLFVSIGYSTCHWCHVMAREAFSQSTIANFLNNYFISIKIDREQRPDIDQFCMSYIQQTQGQGGWPLNIFMTPNLKPFAAMTYVPVTPQYGLPGFLTVLEQLHLWYNQYQKNIQGFSIPIPHENSVNEEKIMSIYMRHFAEYKNPGPQFPPHCTLLFLLSYIEKVQNRDLKETILTLLDTMSQRGLHDHLQGGFFRYCTDENWTIPHFEKMLYDQGMLLWVYSNAYKILKKPRFKDIIAKIILCLDETFENNLKYYTGLDADTEHQEGSTYLWTNNELQTNLTKEEYEQFKTVYSLSPNFEGKIHLTKRKNTTLPLIEAKLLSIRNQRSQPFLDTKIITNWNCIIGIGLIHAYRATGISEYKKKALSLHKSILDDHYKSGRIMHTSISPANQEFLLDYASVLLFSTYIQEETSNLDTLLKELRTKIFQFKDGHWIESKNPDFLTVPADSYDHPTPSTFSLTKLALFRTAVLLSEDYPSLQFSTPLQHDFLNYASVPYHLCTSPQALNWQDLPTHSIQIRGSTVQYCYGNTCHQFSSEEELIAYIQNIKSDSLD